MTKAAIAFVQRQQGVPGTLATMAMGTCPTTAALPARFPMIAAVLSGIFWQVEGNAQSLTS